MRLLKPHTSFQGSFLRGLDEFATDEERQSWLAVWPDWKDSITESFSGFVDHILTQETRSLEGFVCASTFWAVDSGEVLGRITLRHELNDSLRRVGGHVGYIVRPSCRTKGVATAMLSQLLETERAQSIGSLLVTCNEDNMASRRVILRNGGCFHSCLNQICGQPRIMRFWIHRHQDPIDLSRVEAVLFDLDGVLTKVSDESGNFLWLRSIEKDLGITPEEVSCFFREYRSGICRGQRDTRDALSEHIERRSWPVDANEFLSYWHQMDSHIDEEMVSTVQALRGMGYKVYLATNQEHYRMHHMWKTLGLSNHFDGAYPSCQLGFEKPEPEYFALVQILVGLSPEKLLLVDDTSSNVLAARECGWSALIYQHLPQFRSQVFEFLYSRKNPTL
jgi:putative hydrolase of the HAD superfamily